MQDDEMVNSRVRPRVIVLGLDAATFDLLDPWIEQGKLPQLARLMDEGAAGVLLSTIHPISPVAWTSFMTGMNAGKHGIFEWSQRIPDSYDCRPVNSTHILGEPFWRYLNRQGISTGIMNVPLTYPVSAVAPFDGFLISGLLTPGTHVTFSWPKGLGPELSEAVGGYEILGKETTAAPGMEERLAKALLKTVEKRVRAARYLIREYPQDFMMFVFMETDHAQHQLWKFLQSDDMQLCDAILNTYQIIDGFVGDLLAELPEETTIIIMSDHGAGPLEKILYMNSWLISEGFMRVKHDTLAKLKRFVAQHNVIRRLYKLLACLKLSWLERFVPRHQRANLLNSFVSLASDVDWHNTRAYAHGSLGQIYLNVQGREPLGTVRPEEYDDVRDQIIERLYELRDEETGQGIVDRVYRREEIYSGPALELAPDILFMAQEYAYITSEGHMRLDGSTLMARNPIGISATHRRNGILIARGPNIRPGQLAESSLLDLTPTLLYLLGCPIPSCMDGQVCTSLFDKSWLESRPIVWTDSGEITREEHKSVSALEANEEAAIIDRLRGLGYVD